ncbi:MAG: hypothetical protein Q9227_002494 [Pyrenula ochraceoflavens]
MSSIRTPPTRTTLTPSWDAQAVLGIFNPTGLSFTCMAAKAKSSFNDPGTRCCKPLNQNKKDDIEEALSHLLATKSADIQIDRDALQTVADNAFCHFHNDDERKRCAVDQWRKALATARVSYKEIRHLAEVGVSYKSDVGSDSDDEGDAGPVGGSDTDPPSESDSDSSDDDNDNDNDDDEGNGDGGSDAEVENLRQLLKRYKLENRALRTDLEAAKRSGSGERSSPSTKDVK